MGEKDITEKLLEDYNDVFADIVNVLLFNGREEVKPSALVNANIHSQYKADEGKIHELERDVAKYWKDGNTRFALYGIENQTTPDKLMPVRVMGYDGASYKSQIVSKQVPILPVVTIVLYFGNERWNTSRTLKESIEIHKDLEYYVNDYKIHVFEISWLTEEQISMFKSDFRSVADFFVKRRKYPDYIPKDKTEIRHIEEVLKLMSAFTGDHRYEEVLTYPGIKEVGNMCEVFDRAWNGGKAEVLFSLVQDGDLTIEKAAEKMNVDVSEFEKLMEKAGYTLTTLA